MTPLYQPWSVSEATQRVYRGKQVFDSSKAAHPLQRMNFLDEGKQVNMYVTVAIKLIGKESYTKVTGYSC